LPLPPSIPPALARSCAGTFQALLWQGSPNCASKPTLLAPAGQLLLELGMKGRLPKGANMRPEDGQGEAKRILSRIAAESETIGSSNLARGTVSPRLEPEDAIERLGRIVGRTLGYAAVVALLIYLYATYFRPA
jgi:hypothetical protein